MDLYEIIRCVRRRFLVFAIVAVAVIAAGAAYALTQKQTYESTTTLQFGPKKETVLTPTESQSDGTGTTTSSTRRSPSPGTRCRARRSPTPHTTPCARPG